MNFLKIILIAFPCFFPWLNFCQIDLMEVCSCANDMMTCVKDLNKTFILDFGDLKFNTTVVLKSFRMGLKTWTILAILLVNTNFHLFYFTQII